MDILDIPDVDFYSEESDTNLLNGLCKGLISDRGLNSDEIKYLEWWLSRNSALKNNYPGRDLYALVKDILSDGIITEDESSSLYEAIVSFTGCDLDSGVVDGLATRLPIDGASEVTLKGKNFCLTGEFIAGKRSVIQSILEKEGAEVSPRITKKLDFLVIGTLSSRDWKFSSHGRKIEQAVSFRDELGTGIKIISEEMLFSALPRA